MLRSQLVKLLSALPDIEVGGVDNGLVVSVEQSSYDDENGTHDYIALEMSED